MCRFLRCLPLLTIALAGCGGTSSGLPVAGNVTLDGQPLPWGQVYLHDEVDAAGNTNHAFYEIRSGEFASGGQGLPAGSYQATILVHQGDPPPPVDPAAVEASPPVPEIVGQWEGTAEVKADAPLTFAIKKSELKPPEGSVRQRGAPGV